MSRDEVIVREYLAGKSVIVLAESFGISKQRIFQIVQSAGAYRPRLAIEPDPNSKTSKIKARKLARDAAGLRLNEHAEPSERIKTMISLRERGMTYIEIGAEVGVHFMSVSYAMARWRPDLRGRIRPGGFRRKAAG